MKNILKAFLEGIKSNQLVWGTPFSDITEVVDKFDHFYEYFIKQYPIGKAEQSLIDEIYNRARFGYKKYGCTTDEIPENEEIQHAIEESLDLSIYLRVKQLRNNDYKS